ncbi:MAG: hypothetical protein Q9216_001983 [Gyalolechia sp. 2 TL-2023]
MEPTVTGVGNTTLTSTGNEEGPSTIQEGDEPSTTKVPPAPNTTESPPVPTTEPVAELTSSEPPPDPTPTQPVVEPVDPPGEPVCFDPPEGDYKDAHEEIMAQAVQWFCENNAKTIKEPTVDIGAIGFDDPFRQFLDTNDAEDDVYDLSIRNVPDCDPGEEGFDLAEPVSGYGCQDILYNSWKSCEFLHSFVHAVGAGV